MNLTLATAITELALLHLKPPTTLTSPPLLSYLKTAKTAMETYTGHQFHLYSQLEDPSYIYIFGSWASLTDHYEGWIPSKENQDLLEGAVPLFDVEWMFHLDIDQEKKKGGEGVEEGVIPFDAPTIAIERHFMQKNKKAGFLNTFRENKHVLTDFTAPQPICGGWKIEKEKEPRAEENSKGNEQFVLFSGWRDVPHHSEFAKTEGFQRYKHIRDCLTEFEVKHAVKLDV